ncbi:MAG: alpha/beta hydrolase, partial [Flavobacteriales bacterium]|nr:alpha/beta hydrolase [Flavobacteriales bacterium]
ATMTEETFSRIRQPVFVGCYYRNETEQDNVVSVAAMRAMMPKLGSGTAAQRLVEFPNAGNHVITNPMRSGDIDGVKAGTRKFIREVLELRPAVTEVQ